MEYQAYETIVILDPDNPKEKQASIIADIAQNIACIANTKTVWIDDSMGIKKLAYSIKNKGSGYHAVFYYIVNRDESILSRELPIPKDETIDLYINALYPDDVLKHITIPNSNTYSTEQKAIDNSTSSSMFTTDSGTVPHTFYNTTSSASSSLLVDAIDIIFNLK